MKVMKLDWQKYDPEWLVKASEERVDEYPWLPDALSKCTKALASSEYYLYFVDSKNPNKPGSEWQFDENIIIEDTPFGEVALDVLDGNRIGGVEFISKLHGVCNT